MAVAVVMLYPLSMGPAWWIAINFGHSDALDIAYCPLVWIVENVPLLSAPLMWYLHLFAELPK
jgi:hypothetical protein